MVLQNIASIIFIIVFALAISYYIILGRAYSYLQKNYQEEVEKYRLQDTSAGGILANPLKQIKAWQLVLAFLFTNRLKLDDRLKNYILWSRIVIFLILIGLISIGILINYS